MQQQQKPFQKKELKKDIEENKAEDFIANQELINLMENDTDERFKNSEFLKFLKKVQNGTYELKNNELIVNDKPKY